MKYTYDGYKWIVRLELGELLADNLKKLITEEKIDGAWISALGAAQWVELGYYDLQSKQYHWKKFDKLMEIASIQGNVAWDDSEPVLHMHGTFSDEQFQSVGGHVKNLQAGGTVEVLVQRWRGDRLTRKQDDNTGLKVLNF